MADFRNSGRSGGLIITLTLSLLAALPAQASPITASLQSMVDQRRSPGAVAIVVSKDKTLSLDTVGYADLTKKEPMKADAIFWIASTSKAITATALMMLVDEGKVKLDAPVKSYLPDFDPKILVVSPDGQSASLQPPTQPILVRHVLSHMSGLPFTTSIETSRRDRMPLAANVRSYNTQPLLFEPGTNFNYSNAGINVAGRIVEVVSGMPFERFLQSRIFDPLGMKDTTFWPNANQLGRLAKSYGYNPETLAFEEVGIPVLNPNLADAPRRYPVPGGGLFSSAADIARFTQLYLNGGMAGGKRLLSEAAISEMTRNQLPEKVIHKGRIATNGYLAFQLNGYGLGFGVKGEQFSHGGAYLNGMTIDRRKGIAMIWMTQTASQPPTWLPASAVFEQAAMKAFAAPANPK